MNPLSLLSVLRGRGSLYGLLGLLLVSTMWVTSLSLISLQANATDLLANAGASVLNPFLANQGLGLTQQTYDSRKSHLSQALTLTPLNVHMTGADIDKPTYEEAELAVYQRVADAYYTGGLTAAFTIPASLQQYLPFLQGFGFFGSSSAGSPSASGLPDFLQPFFTIIGLTPATFTASGHDNLLHLLPWFWLGALVLGTIAVLLGRSGNKVSGLAKTVTHSAWPVVLVIVGAWIASVTVYKTQFAPYTGALSVVARTFLPVYGIALVLGLVGLFVPKLLALRKPETVPQPVMAGVPTRAQMSAPPMGMGQMGMGPMGTPPTNTAPMNTAPMNTAPMNTAPWPTPGTTPTADPSAMPRQSSDDDTEPSGGQPY